MGAAMTRKPTARPAAAPDTGKSLLAVNDRPSIRERKIIDRLEEFFGREITSTNAPISDYFKGDDGAIRSLATRINRYDGFADDGLGLAPGDLQGVERIGEIIIAIVIWYRRHGWNVVFR